MSGAPWSVKGIDPKAREVAKDLARRSGMTLGEWLNHVILEDDLPEDASSEEQITERPTRAPRSTWVRSRACALSAASPLGRIAGRRHVACRLCAGPPDRSHRVFRDPHGPGHQRRRAFRPRRPSPASTRPSASSVAAAAPRAEVGPSRRRTGHAWPTACASMDTESGRRSAGRPRRCACWTSPWSRRVEPRTSDARQQLDAVDARVAAPKPSPAAIRRR
jgi:hypothetical protein